MASLIGLVGVVFLGLLIGCQPAARPVVLDPEGNAIDTKSLEEYLLRKPERDLPEPDISYPTRIVKPDTGIDHKIVVIPPDPNVDFKINIFPPGGARLIPRGAPQLDKEMKERLELENP